MLIANRGEIARRVSRSCHALGLQPVVVFTEADALSLHVLESEHAVCLGPDKRAYTSVDAIVGVAVEHKCAASACCSAHSGQAGLFGGPAETRLLPVCWSSHQGRQAVAPVHHCSGFAAACSRTA